MSVTIKELAAQLGISHSVVSSVLNNKKYCGVSEKRRREILDKAAELNCQPHLQAQALKRGHTNLVGICMPAAGQAAYVALMLAQQKLLAEQGYLSLFSFWQVPSVSRESFLQELKNAYAAVFSHQVAGIISWYYDDCLKREKIPTVLFGSAHEGFDAVVPDFAGQTELSVDYLTGLGHRRIAYMGFTCIQTDLVRASLSARGLLAGDEYLCVGHRHNPLHFAGEHLGRLLALPEPPTAIICHNTEFAVGVFFAAQILGVRIPESLSLVSMGMSSSRSSSSPHKITLTGTDGPENIRLTVDRLIERMHDPSLPAKTILTPPRLVERGSCAAPEKKTNRK
ncbi:MAG: LacI family DNA-binding transcriptional regulator [Lentisphaeria bacterium]|nr:LacI family DNA-binding transcriptional regulator [Lentisphaeria bacterium]